MLREQRVGDDVPSKQVVHGHVRAVPVRRHAEQDPFMLQRTDEALVPRALRVTEDVPQLAEFDGTGSRVPQLVGDGRDGRVRRPARRIDGFARGQFDDPIANLLQVAVEERSQRTRHRVDAYDLSAASGSSPRRRAAGSAGVSEIQATRRRLHRSSSSGSAHESPRWFLRHSPSISTRRVPSGSASSTNSGRNVQTSST